MNRQRRTLIQVVAACLAGRVSMARAQTVPARPSASSRRARRPRSCHPRAVLRRNAPPWLGRESERRYDWALGDDQEQILPRRAAELVARKPDLIYAPPAPAASAARRATASIPIVFATGTDPVGTGLVQSLGRPGGNVTGAISVVDSLAPKLVQMLREIRPNMTVVGYLGNPEDPRWKIDGEALDRAPGVTRHRAGEVAGFRSGAVGDGSRVTGRQGAQAVITGSSVTFNLRHELMRLSARHRIPVAAHRSEMADAGALFSYGAALQEQIRLSARLVDRVLRGQPPGEIPVEQPTKFELVVNRQTARQLGLSVPSSLLLRADRIIS